MFTVPEVAKRLNISKLDTLYKLIQSGALRASNVATNLHGRPCWRIAPEDLEAFLAARRAVPPEPTTRRRKRKLENVTEYF